MLKILALRPFLILLNKFSFGRWEARRKVIVGFTEVSGTLTNDTKLISHRHIFQLEEDGNKVFGREILFAQ